MSQLALTILLAPVMSLLGGAVWAADAPKDVAFFEKKIRPVLVEHCYKCHSTTSDKVKGGLQLDTWDGLATGGETGPAVVPGDARKSLIIQALKHADGLAMPPDRKLAETILTDFEKWIRLGAPYPEEQNAPKTVARDKKEIDWATAREFWSFQPVRHSAAPAVKDQSWPRTDLDRFVLARLEAEGLRPVADAERVTLIRRLYFDLIGLPPSPEEIDRVLSDKSPNAIASLVDELLESPHFGERWGRHWLDVARYAESNGNVDNNLFPHAWRYRDYVIAAFNQDKPFHQFITEQIAGDLLPASTPEERNARLTATGFLALTSKPRPQNNPDYQMDLIADQIEVSTVAFMGLTVACARCHDHKFDPIPQQDYYAVAAIFESSEMLTGPAINKNKNARFETALHSLQPTNASSAEDFAENLSHAQQDLNAAKEVLQAFLETARRELAAAAKNDPNAKKQAKEAKRDKKQNLQELLKPAQRKQLGKLKEVVAQHEKTLATLEESRPSAGSAMGVTDRAKPVDGRIRIRGDSQKLGDAVPRGVVTVVMTGSPPQFSPSHSGRLEFAQWIASPENPLTARVAVNRIWRQLFGRGIVPTVDNFGALGETPTHPELLDSLATQFVHDGWSVKQLIRSIVLSRTYQLSASSDPAAIERDPNNTLYWRHDARRLDGEALRDAILLVSGSLDPAQGTASIVSAEGPIEVRNGIDRKFSQYESNHRSVYLPMVRNAEPEFLVTFDLPDTELVVGDRNVTTVPSQGLFLLNSPWVVGRAREFAERVVGGTNTPDADRIHRAWRVAFGRDATQEEQQRVLAYVDAARKNAAASKSKPSDAEQQAWTLVCQALFAAAEFRYVR